MSKEMISIVRTQITSGHVGLDCFLPVYNSDFDFMKTCKYKKPVLCSSRKSRNPRHHKLVYAIAKCVLANLPEGSQWALQQPYDLIKAVHIEEGLVEWKLNLDGTVRAEAKSISFESMSEKEFQPVSDAMFKWGARILKIEQAELEKNYMDYL